MCTELKTSKDFLQAKFVEAEQRILALQVTVLNQSETMKKLETNPPASAGTAPSAKNPRYGTWNNDALRDQLYLSLKDRIKDSLAPLERPSTHTELKEMALRLDS